MFNKRHIIDEIKRTAQENGGVPLGTQRFRAQTGIKVSDWQGKFWARWGDALIEAGFQPNVLQGRRNDDELLESLALLTRELGHFPVTNEIKMKARSEPGFPWHNTFARLGNKQTLATLLHGFCIKHGLEDVAILCEEVIRHLSKPDVDSENDNNAGNNMEIGYVYLLRSGKYYKIGRTNSVGRRERELSIQLPEESKTIHSIKTDDPAGIEAYWHKRFAGRRKNGEWFALTANDIAAFKRRKFM